jgi:hypothetical protein
MCVRSSPNSLEPIVSTSLTELNWFDVQIS